MTRCRPVVVGLVGIVWASVATAEQVPTEPAEMFEAFCAVCHGEDGSGQVENPAIDSEPMDFTDCAVATPEPDGDWELVITHGGLAAGLSSEMPSYGDALTKGQIQALIGYIRGFCAEPGWPIGTLNFPRPIFTEKAFPENEFLLLPAFSNGDDDVTELGLRAIYERRLGRRGHVEVRFPFESVSAAGERRSGLGDVKLAGKYVVNTDPGVRREELKHWERSGGGGSLERTRLARRQANKRRISDGSLLCPASHSLTGSGRVSWRAASVTSASEDKLLSSRESHPGNAIAAPRTSRQRRRPSARDRCRDGGRWAARAAR